MLQMNPEIRALWAAALRSGEYVQTQGALSVRQEDGSYHHCCLGVLCDLAAKAGVVTTRTPPLEQIIMYGHERNVGALPQEVYKWAGLTDPTTTREYWEDPILHSDWKGIRMRCGAANDSYHLSFNDIADLIDGGGNNASDEA